MDFRKLYHDIKSNNTSFKIALEQIQKDDLLSLDEKRDLIVLMDKNLKQQVDQWNELKSGILES